MKTPIYLDHHATTPVDPRVLAVWERTAREHFGNPSSSGHAFGWAASKLVELAREQVAALIGATAREILFTSGATEADNLAVLGVARAAAGRGRDGLVSTNLEHPAVKAPLAHLANHEGWRLTTVAADTDGIVSATDIAAAVDERTLLVSVIAAQNEIGTVQPVAEVGAVCRAAGAYFHVDAAQAAGRVDLDVGRDHLDLVALSGHKIYGPKGVGALFVRRRDPRVTLTPLLYGGGQERDLRPGTLNVPAIAAEFHMEGAPDDSQVMVADPGVDHGDEHAVVDPGTAHGQDAHGGHHDIAHTAHARARPKCGLLRPAAGPFSLITIRLDTFFRNDAMRSMVRRPSGERTVPLPQKSSFDENSSAMPR